MAILIDRMQKSIININCNLRPERLKVSQFFIRLNIPNIIKFYGNTKITQVQNFPTARECVSSRSSGVDSDLTGSLDLAFKELDRRTDHPANMPVPERNTQQGQYVKNRRSVSESRHGYCT